MSLSNCHAADFIDSPAERTDPVMALSFRQYCLLEPVMEIARYHLYEQIQFITFIINLAVLTESKAGFDFINRSLNGTYADILEMPIFDILKYKSDKASYIYRHFLL